jgi:hypothetical protein
MYRKTICAVVALLALRSTALAPMSAMAGGRHGGGVHSDAKCGVNSIAPGGTLREPGCRLR